MMQRFLPGLHAIATFDLAVAAGVAAVVGAVTVAAGCLPARGVLSAEPMTALTRE